MGIFKNKNNIDSSATVIPTHVGIIMDGNGRWAKKRGLPRTAGHKVGADKFTDICRYCNELGIKYLTVYAFSTENWARPDSEVNSLMSLFKDYLSRAFEYKKDNIKVRIIGDRAPLDDEINTLIDNLERDSADCTGTQLNIAINYGGQDEIVSAVKNIATMIKNGDIKSENIDKEVISSHLYTVGQPSVDLVIRPSGEMRLSNFMIWQTAYAEFVFLDTLWPDFSRKEMDRALKIYSSRSRRFGGI